MSDNICFEIQMEIIKKVADVKSLIRCRAVSKQWKSFIDTSEFITCYGARDTHPHHLLLRYNYNYHDVKYISCIDDRLQQQQDFAPNVPDLVKQLRKSVGIRVPHSEVIGSSCGLWCFHGKYKTEMVVIWNPSIRKSVGIVVPHLLNNTPEKINHFGFGVCPSTYDPTIVGMSMCFRMNKTWQVGIFTLSSKAWKMIPSSNVPRESISVGSTIPVAAGRFIFWVAYGPNVGNDGLYQYTSLILSFDLITHEFKEVHLPVSLANNLSLYISISKLNESLVVCASTVKVDDGLVYGVWMMGEEGGVMTSFIKLFNINTPDSSIRRLLGFRKTGEPIMETIKKDEELALLEVYEPCSKHINSLGIYGARGSFFICPYAEALLLIDHSDGCIISDVVVGSCPTDGANLLMHNLARAGPLVVFSSLQ